MTTGMAGVYLILGATAFGWIRFFIAFNKQRPRRCA